MVDRLLATVEAYPGLHVRELARQLATSVALVEYHLEALKKEAKIDVRQEGQFLRVYRRGGPIFVAADQRALGVLRRKWPLRIVLELIQAGPLRHGELAKRIGLGKSGLSFHLATLEAAFVVTRADDGLVALRDPQGLRELIERWKPTSDMVAEFEDVWDAFYRR